MKGVFFRLFVRANLLWELFVVFVLARILSFLCGGAEAIWRGDAEAGEPLYEAADALAVHLALLSGAGIGLIANFTLQDLGYCRVSWLMPGLGRGLRRELTLLAAAVTVLSAIGFALFGSWTGCLGFAALTLLGFGLGNLWWDPAAGKGRGLLAQAAILTLLLTSRSVSAWIESAPLMAGAGALLIAVIVSTYAVRRGTAREVLRARALVAPSELGSSFRAPADVLPYKAGKLERTRGWTHGRIAGFSAWARALLFEDAGWARGSWVGRAVSFCVPVAAVTALLVFGLGLRSDGTWKSGLAWVAQAVFDPELRLEGLVSGPPRHVANLGFATAVFMIVLGARQDLRHGVLYPLSRRARAEVVWRAGLVRGLLVVGVTAAGFLVLGLASLLLSQVAFPVRRVPEIFTVMAWTAVLLPGLQWLRLRFLEGRAQRWSPTVYGTIAGLSSAAFTVAIAVGMEQARQTGPLTVAVLTFAGLPLAYLAAQQLYRRAVRVWFERTDLV